MPRKRLRGGILAVVLICWPVIVYLVSVFDWMGWFSILVYGYAAHCARLYGTMIGTCLGCGLYLNLPYGTGANRSPWDFVFLGVVGLAIGLMCDLASRRVACAGMRKDETNSLSAKSQRE